MKMSMVEQKNWLGTSLNHIKGMRHTETYCLRILLSCFRERTSGTRPTALVAAVPVALLWAEAAAVELVPILAVLRAADLVSSFWVLF